MPPSPVRVAEACHGGHWIGVRLQAINRVWIGRNHGYRRGLLLPVRCYYSTSSLHQSPRYCIVLKLSVAGPTAARLTELRCHDRRILSIAMIVRDIGRANFSMKLSKTSQGGRTNNPLLKKSCMFVKVSVEADSPATEPSGISPCRVLANADSATSVSAP